MYCQISDDDNYDDVKVVLNNKAIKLFQIQVMTHLQELKIQKNQLRKFQQNILPFYLKKFVINLLKNDSQTEITQIKSLFRPHQLNNKQYKYLQEKWIDYMEGQALFDVIKNISSKKIRIVYLQALDLLQREIQINKNPYCFLCKTYDGEEAKSLLKCDYQMKSHYQLVYSMQTKRKMIIRGKQGK